MGSIYAEALNSFTTDLDNIWKEKKKLQLQNQKKVEGDCSLNRFLLSASAKNIGQKKNEYVNNIERLKKTTAIWIQPDFTRNDVDKVLQQFEVGIFIVRVNSDNKTMVLSYRTDDKVQHVRIKVDLRKGFYMDGSQNIFKNVNEMISHYMTHSIQSPDLLLKLPRVLREATDISHFKFFENLKSDFWKTSLPNKSITEIFINTSGVIAKEPHATSDYNEVDDYESTPPLPPREYNINDLGYIQGLAEEADSESDVYNVIVKEPKNPSNLKPSKEIPQAYNDQLSDQRIYTPVWHCDSHPNTDVKSVPQNDDYSVIDKTMKDHSSDRDPKKLQSEISDFSINVSTRTEMTILQPDNNNEQFKIDRGREKLQSEISQSLINDSIRTEMTTLQDNNYEKFKTFDRDREKLQSEISQSLINDSIRTEMTTLQDNNYEQFKTLKRLSLSSIHKDKVIIRDIISYYYPQIVDIKYSSSIEFASRPSLSQDILKNRNKGTDIESKVDRQIIQNECEDANTCEECEYDTPWELKTPWISKYMDIENYEGEKQYEYMDKIVKSDSFAEKSKTTQFSSLPNIKDSNESVNTRPAIDRELISLSSSKKVSVISSTDDESDDAKEKEETLQFELLAELQPVFFSSTKCTPTYNQKKSPYGQSIRKYLIQLCSSKGHSDISNSVKTFIQCTLERTDLSPYTTMRLIRQYMSGLKNLIKQQKSEYSLLSIIEKERKITPRNVFINFDSIIESVLTKAVVKPLSSFVYQLLVLEHYKNNNLNSISDGVEEAKKIEPKSLGLKEFSIPIINSKLSLIKKKFQAVAKQYAPEKKIAQIISIIEIIFQIVKQVYPEARSDSMRNDFKSDYLLPVLVYIFSQCKTDAIATQCEVEYIEGLIWSSTLVDGEPGFYLMNIMSSLEAIKVLARPKIDLENFVDLRNNKQTKIDNSSFFKQINPSTVSVASIGSVNVIILDEKLSRLVTKTFPVRSTVTVGNLCFAIAHRLGIFNPKEYNLYKYTGTEDILLDEYDYPLSIKQSYQQKTGETLNFLFKRKNAIFILPPLITGK